MGIYSTSFFQNNINEKSINEKSIYEKSIYEKLKAEYEAKQTTHWDRCRYLVNTVVNFKDAIAKTLEIDNGLISGNDPNFDGLPYLFIDLSSDGKQKKPNEINPQDISIEIQDDLSALYYVDYSILIYLGQHPYHLYEKLISIRYRTISLNGEDIAIQAEVFNDNGFVKELVLHCVSEVEYKKVISKAVDDFIRRVREEIEIS